MEGDILPPDASRGEALWTRQGRVEGRRGQCEEIRRLVCEDANARVENMLHLARTGTDLFFAQYDRYTIHAPFFVCSMIKFRAACSEALSASLGPFRTLEELLLA